MAAVVMATEWRYFEDRIDIIVSVQHASTDTQTVVRNAANAKINDMNTRHPKTITYSSASYATSGTTRVSKITYTRPL